MSDTSAPSPSRGRLAALGAYGFEAQEPVILAALASGDPILLIGRSGTGKTFLLNSISEALGLEHRHYNASLISFDDLVGFPYPDEAKASVRFLETPATVWGAESVLIDEISRCKPEHQNRLFSLVHERKIQGLAAHQAALPLGGDEPVLDGPVRRRGVSRRRTARPGAGRSLRGDPRGGRLGCAERRRSPARGQPGRRRRHGQRWRAAEGRRSRSGKRPLPRNSTTAPRPSWTTCAR